MFRPLLTAAAVLTLATAGFTAANAAPTPAKAPAAPLVCPVTGETIASVNDAAGSSVYKGKTYYFCCSSCKPAFDKDPAKYIKTASAAAPAPAH